MTYLIANIDPETKKFRARGIITTLELIKVVQLEFKQSNFYILLYLKVYKSNPTNY